MIDIINNNLRQINDLLKLTQSEFTDQSTGPYYSSIGGHIRHVLDIFKCLSVGLESGTIDLTLRERGVPCEDCPALMQEYLDNTVSSIDSLSDVNPSLGLVLIDDLGGKKVKTPSTLGSVLFQAHSHAIHHFAIIGYLLHIRNIAIPNITFGYNPTTPIHKKTHTTTR